MSLLRTSLDITTSHHVLRRLLSTLPPATPCLHDYPTFGQMVTRHKQIAQCSFVLEDRTKNAFVWHQHSADISRRLLDGHGGRIYRWRVGSADGKQRRFLLVECNSIASLRLAVRVLDHKHQLPMYDRICFLKDHHIADTWRDAVGDRQSRIEVQHESNPLEASYQIVFDGLSSPASIPFEDYNLPAGTSLSRRALSSPSSPLRSVTTKVASIHKLLQGEELLSTLQYKVRFFILNQMEQIIRRCSAFDGQQHPRYNSKRAVEQLNLMSHYELVPFGSEVSGFGCIDSDLDLCFVNRGGGPNSYKVPFHRGIRLLHNVSIMLERSRKLADLKHHDRVAVHNHFGQVQRIFRAFIPIIKCRAHLLPQVNIDISVDTEKNSGVQMAGYLYQCTKADPRVRSFILLLKTWAKHHRIVQETPGEWFSSFQITMLGVGFLQSRGIVPTIEQWQRRTGAGSISRTPDSANLQEVTELLKAFFHFMVGFDFWRHAFDLNTGHSNQTKPHADRDACYIVNPFLRHLNICKTVSEAELERFLSKCQQSLEIMSKPSGYQIEELFEELHDRLLSIHMPSRDVFV